MSWNKTDETVRPDQGKSYWITVGRGERATVLLAKWGKKYWSFENGERIRSKVEAWWDRPVFVPRPFFQPEEKGRAKAETNGKDESIIVCLLSDERMRGAGFTDDDPNFWIFRKEIDGTFEFSLTVEKENPKRFRIDVLDDETCRAYDFKAALEKNPDDETALKVKAGVDGFLGYLAGKGAVKGFRSAP